jgi:predicted ATP-grasp superfamily ATP-dependent carboligase
MDKWTLAQEARRAGIAIPETILASTSEEMERASGSVTYPIVIKPRRAADWRTPTVWELVGRRKAVRVESAGELLAFYARIRKERPEILLQEWVAGEENEFYIHGCYRNPATTGTVGLVFRKWLQYPSEFGTGCLVECIDAHFVALESERLLENLGYTGFAEVEFKRDGRTGELKLIEINPRPWDQHSLATGCGMNLSLIAFRDALGETSLQATGLRKGWWIAGEGLIRRFAEELRAGHPLNRELIRRVLMEKKVYPLFHLTDPMPFLHGTWDLAWEVAGSVLRYLKGKRM